MRLSLNEETNIVLMSVINPNFSGLSGKVRKNKSNVLILVDIRILYKMEYITNQISPDICTLNILIHK